MKRRFVSTCLMAALAILFACAAGRAETPRPKVVVFTIPGVTWEDLNKFPDSSISKLRMNGASAAMNVRVQGYSHPLKAYMSFGAGNRMDLLDNTGTFFHVNEMIAGTSAGEIYSANTGVTPPEDSIVLPGIEFVKLANSSLGYDALPGALGTVLRGNGLKTAVLGNSDSFSYRGHFMSRDFAAMAMDRNGIVDMGDVSPMPPGGNRTPAYGALGHTGSLLEEFNEFYQRADLLVVDAGLLYPTGSYKDPGTGTYIEDDFIAALNETDKFIGKCLYSVDTENTVVIVASPLPSFDDYDYLMPIIISGPGFEHETYLTSPSTHRPGIVTNADVLPTILGVFGLKPGPEIPTTGNRMHSIPGSKSDPVKMSFIVNRAYNVDRNLRAIGVNGFVVVQVFLFLIFVFYLHYPERMSRSFANTGMWLALLVLNFPLSSYIANILLQERTDAAVLFGVMFLISGALAFVGMKIPKPGLWKVAFFSLLTTLFIAVDVCTGAHATLNSIFGYSPMIGGRYYGIGNESMSLVTVAGSVSLAVMAGALKNAKLRIAFFAAAALALTTIVGFPRLGANTGGIITVVCAFTMIFIKFTGRNLSAKHILIFFIAVAAMLAIYIGYDYISGPDTQTHLGRAFAQIHDGGFRQVQLIAGRKLSMNLKVFVRYSPYMLLWLLLSVTIYGWPNEIRKIYTRIFRDNPFLYIGFQGAFVGSIVGMCLNDTGVVILCLIVSYLITCLNFLSLETIQQDTAR